MKVSIKAREIVYKLRNLPYTQPTLIIVQHHTWLLKPYQKRLLSREPVIRCEHNWV